MNAQTLYNRIKQLVEANERFDQTDKNIIKTIAVQAIWEEMGSAALTNARLQNELGELKIQLTKENEPE